MVETEPGTEVSALGRRSNLLLALQQDRAVDAWLESAVRIFNFGPNDKVLNVRIDFRTGEHNFGFILFVLENKCCFFSDRLR